MRRVTALATCLVGLVGCATPAHHSVSEDGISRIGSACPSALARLYRRSDPVHDVVEVRYDGPGSVVIQTYDELLRPVATTKEPLTRPVDSTIDTFALPLTKGVVVRAARLTIATSTGSTSCVVQDKR